MKDGYTTGKGLGLGPERRKAPVERIRNHILAGSGHHGHARALEVT